MKKHRNSPKRYYEENEVYFIVVKTQNNYPYFKEPIFCDLLIEEIKLCKKIKKFNLFAFSIIYDHLNLLIQPGEEYNISKVMQSIKKETSRDINYIISDHHAVGDIPECRLRGKQYSYRFDKEYTIPNLSKCQNQFIQKYDTSQHQFPKFKWQKSFYDHVIRDDRNFEYHYDYTVYNHQKHGLPDDWQYTSLNWVEVIDKILI
ncbi:transposase [Patescibacteria group bacterium]|nr:transposase [Patescibacteria group bacterium]